MIKNILFISIILMALASCSKQENSSVMIRISNISSHDFQNVTLINEDITSIPSGQKSAYYEFEQAYRYGFIRLDLNGDTYTLQPIDFVGETPLKNGNYTYEVNADTTQRMLSLNFVSD